MLALSLAFLCCWFIVLAYRYLGGTVLLGKVEATRAYDARQLQQFREDIENELRAGTLFSHRLERIQPELQSDSSVDSIESVPLRLAA